MCSKKYVYFCKNKPENSCLPHANHLGNLPRRWALPFDNDRDLCFYDQDSDRFRSRWNDLGFDRARLCDLFQPRRMTHMFYG